MVASITRPELSAASDEVIDDAVQHADAMVLRGLLYQLTADPEVAATKTRTIFASYFNTEVVVDSDVPLLKEKAAAYLKKLRDSGNGEVDIGPRDRLPKSLELLLGRELKGEDLAHHLDELALDPSVRSLHWKQEPDEKKLKEFNVVVVGSGMGGLNASIQLRKAGIPFTVVEKNDNVGGTWWVLLR
jgi:4-hydroxyacetophenone monooxygenase